MPGYTGFDDRNVIGFFLTAYEEAFAGSWGDQVSLYNGASNSAKETYGILGSNPAMREWIGARQAQVNTKATYEIRNRLYEATLEVMQSDLDRDKTGLLRRQIGAFAAEAGAGQWTNLLVDLINANGNCYDGQAFFSATHSWGASGTQKNLVTATEVPSANVATTTAPTPTEIANILLESFGYMVTLVNDKGRPINGQMKSLVVQCATAPIFSAAVQAVGNMVLAASINNPLTGLMQAGISFKPILVPTLTSATTKIRLYRTDGQVAPFIRQEERGVNLETLGPGSDYYFEHRAIKLGVDASRGVGYGEPLYALDVSFS